LRTSRFLLPRLRPRRADPSVVAALLAIFLASDVLARYSPVAGSGADTAATEAVDPPGIAARYPRDVGIESDPDVVFVEKFDETSTAPVFSRWTDILNGASMSLTTDVPAGSSGTRSLTIPWTGGGVNPGGHLYKQLTPGVDDTLYIRYYVKYPTTARYSHDGVWTGGYNPPLGWPNPQAGTKPAGNDRFSAAAEVQYSTSKFDHYDYWMNMHLSNDGQYWGNVLLNNPAVTAPRGQWICVEQMVKLNNPVSAMNGEHAIWLNGVKMSHLGQGFPNGSWSGGNFIQNPTGTPFEGFKWRSDANLKLNYLWLQAYAPDDVPGTSASMKFDHLVAARSYVGCLSTAPASPPAAPTNLRIVTGASVPTPAAVATVTVAPATVSIQKNATQQLTATLRDSSGNVLTGRAITWSSSSMSAATVSAAGLVTGVNSGSATITATSEGKSGTAVVTVLTTPSTGWPNEPAGMVKLTENAWDALTGNGWNFLRRSSTQNPSIVADNAAPFSPSNALRIVYSAGCCVDAEPSVHWYPVPLVREIYTGYWVKLSSNWIPNPAGGGKISFLFTDVGGQVYTNYYHPSNDGSVQGPPYRIGANTEWAPYGQRIWLPNVATTWINNGEWHRIEFYYKWETTPGVSGDGIIRWWVDGTLNGDHRNVTYPSARFLEFQIAPTVQFAGTQDRYMYVDHTYISTR
jgi:hypothetical protein